jgi:hypothetical protein
MYCLDSFVLNTRPFFVNYRTRVSGGHATDWSKLRVWKGSQNSAFEELCCQLAHVEPVPPGSCFVRNAAPDAGVECIWRLPNGDEWGWQAKFPQPSSPNAIWSELDKSVRVALSKRPNLTRYFVCLPQNLPDAHTPGKKSGRQKWNDRVKKWNNWCRNPQSCTQFELWDDHELWLRLSSDQNRGRRAFWFGDVVIDRDWLQTQFEIAKANAGERYDAALNVPVPEAGLFPSLARTSVFWDSLDEWAINLRSVVSSELKHVETQPDATERAQIRESVSKAIAIINAFSRNEYDLLNFSGVRAALEVARTASSAWRNSLWESQRKAYQEFEAKHGRRPEPYEHVGDFDWHTLREVEAKLGRAVGFLDTDSTALANLPALLVGGEAGSGKTHLLCEATGVLLAAGAPAVLLLGDQFHDSEPWHQILGGLDLDCSRSDFLGALDAAAEASGTRAVIIIDALNEGDGLKVWPKHMLSFLKHIKKWPRLAVCLSVRNGYGPAIFPKALKQDEIVSVTHHGFSEIETEAALQFFDHFGISIPSIPVLTPEFSNPLFLKLFCRAVENSGAKQLPTGVQGITAVFDFFLDTVNHKLAHQNELDFDVSARIVQRAVERLAELMADQGETDLPASVVQAELHSLLPREGYEKSLVRKLHSEHVLVRHPHYDYATRTITETIQFTYQRFTDHLIARAALMATKRDDVKNVFATGSSIQKLFKSASWYWRTQGLWDALAIQLPESFGVELHDLLSQTTADSDTVRDAFAASLVWRKPERFTDRTAQLIEKYLAAGGDDYDKVMDALLTVGGSQGHPFNAEYLHAYLSSKRMPERDASWSIFLFTEYGQRRAVDRLIAWGASERAHIGFDDETVQLNATALMWFLSTSHRFVRDRATKSLVSILENRLNLVRALLRKFKGVDDPYISERAYAVAFGCALKSTDQSSLRTLAQQVYDDVFKSGTPPAHILLRDYAKGIVQTAVNQGVQVDHEPRKILPPYRTRWIHRLPSLKSLEKKMKDRPSASKKHGASSVYFSVTHGDFGTYELNDLSMWSSRRLHKRSPQSALQIYESFVSSLNDQETELFSIYKQAAWGLFTMGRLKDFKPDREYRHRSRLLLSFEMEFAKYLTKHRSTVFRTKIVPMLRNSGAPTIDDSHDRELLQRWILWRVIKLGYDVKKHGKFDSNVDSHFRESHKAERIGKKYQWIALHEFYARLSDNFQFAMDYRGPTAREQSNGSWTSHFRDIDPSLLIRATPRDGWGANLDSWWLPLSYDNWFGKPTRLGWLKATDDIPAPNILLQPGRSDGSEWLLMDGYAKWKREEHVGSVGMREPDQQELWVMFKAYLVRAADFSRLWKWASRRSWFNKWMPEAHGRIRVCLHEHYASPVFSRPLAKQWQCEVFGDHQLPYPILLATDEYLCEAGTHDCSIDETISIGLPSQWIARRMALKMGGRKGAFFSADQQLIAFDPSTDDTGHSAVVFRKQPFIEFLNRSGYRIFWTFLAEKNIYPPTASRGDWSGRLELSGAYTIRNGAVVGAFNPIFHQGGSVQDSAIT